MAPVPLEEELQALGASEQQTRTVLAKVTFLRAFGKRGIIKQGADAARCARSTVYAWLDTDEQFRKLYAEVRDDATDLAEEEAHRRGIDGWLEPVWHQGDVCGHIRRHSDMMLAIILRGRRPEVYRERHEVTGKDGGPIATTPIFVSYDHRMAPPDEPKSWDAVDQQIQRDADAAKAKKPS